MKLAYHHAKVAYPAKEPPSWAPLVERWYQLDPYAYLLPEAFTRFGLGPRPASMLLASAGASSLTDHAFAAGGAVGPTKFVHTLPNIRASSLLSVMRWGGPVISLHRDPFTLAFAFREAIERAGDGECWVWNAGEDGNVHLFRFGPLDGATHSCGAGPVSPPPSDLEILRSFWDSEAKFNVLDWVVRQE